MERQKESSALKILYWTLIGGCFIMPIILLETLSGKLAVWISLLLVNLIVGIVNQRRGGLKDAIWNWIGIAICVGYLLVLYFKEVQ